MKFTYNQIKYLINKNIFNDMGKININQSYFRSKKGGYYKIIGTIKGKKYESRIKFKTEYAACKHAGKLSYNPSGNTKRKNGLHSYQIIEIKPLGKKKIK